MKPGLDLPWWAIVLCCVAGGAGVVLGYLLMEYLR